MNIPFFHHLYVSKAFKLPIYRGGFRKKVSKTDQKELMQIEVQQNEEMI